MVDRSSDQSDRLEDIGRVIDGTADDEIRARLSAELASTDSENRNDLGNIRRANDRIHRPEVFDAARVLPWEQGQATMQSEAAPPFVTSVRTHTSPPRTVKVAWLVAAAVLLSVSLVVIGVVRRHLEGGSYAEAASKSSKRLEQIAVAIREYAAAHGRLPSPMIMDENGNGLLSWRVTILPYLGEDGRLLYQEFRLNEPWDSDHNRALISRMPTVFHSPLRQQTGKGRTTFLMPLGNGSVFSKPESPDLSSINDAAKTILLVDAVDDEDTVWTRPNDLSYDADDPHKGLVGPAEAAIHVITVDGKSHFVDTTVGDDILRKLFDPSKRKDAIDWIGIERLLK